METLTNVLEIDRASLLLRLGSSALRVAASSDALDAGDLVLSLERYPELQAVLVGNEPVLVTDVSASPMLSSQLEAIRRAGVVSLAAVPFSSGELSGVLRAISRSRQLAPDDLDSLGAAAHLLEHVVSEEPRPETEGTAWLELMLRVTDGVMVVGSDGTVRRVVGRWDRLGADPAGMVGQPLERLVEPEEADAARAEALLVLQGGRPSTPSVFRLRTADGRGPRVRVWAVRRLGGRGLLVAVRREEERSEGPFSPGVLLESLPGLAMLVGPDDTVEQISGGLHDRIGTARDRVIGAELSRLLARNGEAGGTLYLPGSEPVAVDVEEASLPDGRRVLVLSERRQDGPTEKEERLRRTIARNLEELEEMNRRLETMDLERTRFLAWSAHELKTPLTVIQSHLEIVLDDLADGLGEEALGFLRIAHESSRRMRRMVLDLTDLAALQSGRLHLEIERVPVQKTLESLSREMEPAARAAGVRLALAEPVEAAVRADKGRVGQVLHNLLDNAIRFTPEGGSVELGAEVGEERVAIRVTDSGVGIAPDQLELVFEPFVQAGRPPAGRARGSGLGLFVCRRIALALGGRIEAAGRAGAGSIFTLWLPLWPEDEISG